ncbi:MAG: DUF4041 domain-containing protein [Variovorax sp.]|nr:DUF4041 domain-containing protein [Variovorax sp.]
MVERERELKASIEALENRLKGYDDSYLQPAALLLEELAEGYGSQEAAEALKTARAATRTLLKAGHAATCECAEANRRQTAMRFVTDAFNGAADSILSRIKVDNAGKLAQEMKDAAATIAMHGRAFRNAAVTSDYLSSRLEELRAAAQFQALLKREQEEQRAIKERMREEAVHSGNLRWHSAPPPGKKSAHAKPSKKPASKSSQRRPRSEPRCRHDSPNLKRHLQKPRRKPLGRNQWHSKRALGIATSSATKVHSAQTF